MLSWCEQGQPVHYKSIFWPTPVHYEGKMQFVIVIASGII
jgi:hypothetical protein